MSTNRFRELATEFGWVHQGIGILGGVTFFVGSVCFLWSDPVQRIGVWLFIVGSFGMLVGSVGSFVVDYERRQRDRRSARSSD